MKRPPLANLFAVYDGNPAALEEIMQDLKSSGKFAEVWRPASGWVAASAPLPGGEPDGEAVRNHWLAFAEGRDVLENHPGKDLNERLREITELADTKPESLASLPGDFGFIRFRPDGGATVVRSCGGLVPFYLGQFNGCFAISTRLGDFVRYLPDEPRLDPLANAIWALGWPTFADGRTFLAGVTLLDRGCFTRIEGEHLKFGCYWNPRPKRIRYPTPAMAREHAEKLRTILIEKLKRDLDPAGGNLLTLSGGVDSSSLAALAAGTLGLPVWTWSTLPSKENEQALQYEMSYIEPLAQRYGFERRWDVFYHDRLVFELWHKAPRIVFHVLHPALCSLPGIIREANVKVLFGGEYADEVCGSSFTIPDWAYHTSLIRLLTDVKGLLKEPKGPARWLKQRLAFMRKEPALPIPGNLLTASRTDGKTVEFFSPQVIEEYQVWYERQKKRLLEDRRPWRYLALESKIMDGFVTMNWEACSALGIRRSLPFFTREVFELVFSCHPTELYGSGVKKLLRRALKDDVPEHNLFRQDKGMGRWAGQTRSTFGNAVHSWKEPFPKEPLPEELKGIVKAEWFSNPPKELTYWQYRPLTRLLIFIESLRARRQKREESIYIKIQEKEGGDERDERARESA